MLVRVGIDQTWGGWNAPVDPETGEFVYVPIPEQRSNATGLATPYSLVRKPLRRFHRGRLASAVCDLPAHLARSRMHLDPDFARLTYGDSPPRSNRIAELASGDLLVFYAGLRPTTPEPRDLIYALIGIFVVAEIVLAAEVPPPRRYENAHTRRAVVSRGDLVVRARVSGSGRFTAGLDIGERRGSCYFVRADVLDAWGGLSVANGYVSRSGVLPWFERPDRFTAWLQEQSVDLLPCNNP